MRKLLSALFVLFFISNLNAQSACDDAILQDGGIEPWPWLVAQPFPWDNINGYWKFSNDDSSYIKAVVLSATQKRKLLKLTVYDNGVCSAPFAMGTGYISVSEKNVVRSIMTGDNRFKYQLKIGLFEANDILSIKACSNTRIMAASMQVLKNGRNIRNHVLNSPEPISTETRNVLLKKVSVNPEINCKK